MYSSGVWDDRCLVDGASESGVAITSSFDDVKNAIGQVFEDYRRKDMLDITRLFVPMQCINEERSTSDIEHRGDYQDVYVMMAVDHECQSALDSQVIHAHVTGVKNGQTTIGSVSNELMTYSPDAKMHLVFGKRRDTYNAEYQLLWREQPRNALPDAATQPQQLVEIRGTLRAVMDIPSRSFDAVKVKFRQCMARLKTVYNYDTYGMGDNDGGNREIAKGLFMRRLYITTPPQR